jgi:hypothetical protein
MTASSRSSLPEEIVFTWQVVVRASASWNFPSSSGSGQFEIVERHECDIELRGA